MNATIETLRRLVRRELWLVCAASATLTTAAWAQDQDVDVTDLGTVTLTVKDTDLAQVLEMLAIQSRKNIITSKNVSGTISANLYDVTFYEALDAILRVNGYGYVEEGSFIYVYTGPELEEIQRATQRTESRVYQLEHLAAADAFEFITPLLSESGRASFRGDVPTGFKPDIADGGADSYAFTPRIVVNDFPENLDAISELLGDLDSPPQQVLVEATIVQAQLDEKNAFGIDFSVLGSINFTDLTRPLSAVDNLLAGSDDSNGVQPDDNKAFTSQSTVGNTPGEGGLKIGILTDDISVFLRVLDEVTDSVVLARPKIMCLNRQRAEVLVGARIGFLSTTATETSTTQSVEFLDTGIQLVFRPFISRSGMVRMELAPSVSEASLRSVTDANGLIVTIPDELTNELTTNVRVPDGQTLVLGGLFRESTRTTRRQVPVLGDIPVVGAAFRGQDDEIDRNEIVFLITPTIIEDEIVGELGAEALTYLEQARVGARNGLLPFSRDRIIHDYNRDAIEAYQGGDIEKALYYTNASLRQKPIQPEMMRFREQLTGGRERLHEQAVLERILRRKLGALEAEEPDLEARFEIPTTPPAFLGTSTLVPPAPADDDPVVPASEETPFVAPREPRPSAASAGGPMGEDPQANAGVQADTGTDAAMPETPATVDVAAASAASASRPSVASAPATATPSSEPATMDPAMTGEVTASVTPAEAETATFDQLHRSFLEQLAWPTVSAAPENASDDTQVASGVQFETFDAIIRSTPSSDAPADPAQETASGDPVESESSDQDMQMPEAIVENESAAMEQDSVETPAIAVVESPAPTGQDEQPQIPFDSFPKIKAAPTREPEVVAGDAEVLENGDFPIESFDVEEPSEEQVEVVEVPVDENPDD